MKTLTLLLAGTALSLSACGHKNDAPDASASNDAANVAIENVAAAGSAIPAAPTGAQGFANMAAASDRFEIETSKLAAGSAKSAAVKSFATKMISAHGATTAKLKATLAAMNPPLTPDDTLSADQQQSLDGLKGKTGADFDTAYAAAQVQGHQATLDGLKAYAAAGDNEALKELAGKTVPTVTAHLNMAKGLK
jgi:putative membrane protein